ncbi:choline dehydrogenase [Virgisporangium aliadipatigenens]|uniref:Choline dehydrogenase n=1 Tax=Virgisporangium aliadipatigenens TaxID=741659 RepID=A0A8J3YF98_9ACTN|nr:GMC family oxidoreductase [Virgisporangium aliadipatigenens]GIJ44069.1 choline dehydrogenase [Virgisporangium aliadipatigenens]
MTTNGCEEYDYIVVGSGAGGGPVALRLAEAGASVLLIEAGTDDEDADYRVPGFHARSTENPLYSWNYFVRHYADDTRQRRDDKYVAGRDGVLYPRAGTLGGCTAHNAMITVCPPNADWDRIAEATGDASWRGVRMRRHFQRLEKCGYVPRPRPLPRNRLFARLLSVVPFVSDRYVDRGRHGHDGWLRTTLPDPTLLLRDKQLLRIVVGAVESELRRSLGRPLRRLERFGRYLDPNDWRVLRKAPEGLWLTPLAVTRGRRNGTREALLAAAERHRLTIRTGCLATRVTFDGDRAVGVEYLEGAHLYRADPAAGARPATGHGTVTARHEVILAGGAFNTPQLLMLSGIGPAEELARHGIPLRVPLPGVGRNLQDRYEVGVVSEVDDDFALLSGLTFRAPGPGEEPDPGLREWRESGRGVYAGNGVVLGITRRSSRRQPVPDLFVFGLPARFTGYYPGWSDGLEQQRNVFTWAVLKARTVNDAGRVRLRSADPRDVPEITFHSFDEGSDARGEDLDAVVRGIEFVRGITRRWGVRHRELVPGPGFDDRAALRAFVRDRAWGHHACGTCRMGRADDPAAVLDSRFRVRGTKGLRVVDASVFPRIPGYFIATAIYMAAEKAAEAILADRASTARPATAGARR